MIRTYKYRAYINKKTTEKVEHWLRLCCWLYNCALEERISVYKSHNKSLYLYDQQKELTVAKKQFTELKAIDSQVLLEVLERLDKAFLAFYRWLKKGGERVGYPRFKSENRFDSFTLRWKSGWKLEGKYLRVSKLGVFKLKLSRSIQGKIKKITIKKSKDNKWYVYFVCVDIPEKVLRQSDLRVGLDVGINSFVTDSEGNKFGNPRYFRQAEKQIRRRERKLSRRIVGSKGHQEARVLVAEAWDKVTNQRNDHLHKVANVYIAKYGEIYIENLTFENLRRNKKLGKHILDSGWGRFFDLLIYKAEEAGRQVIKVTPTFTSKRCSVCGIVNYALKLKNRIWSCEACGVTHDRDINAAINIRNSGVKKQSGEGGKMRVGQTRQALTQDNSLSVACESLQEECQDDTFTFKTKMIIGMAK